MAKSIKEALEAAQKESGVTLPTKADKPECTPSPKLARHQSAKSRVTAQTVAHSPAPHGRATDVLARAGAQRLKKKPTLAARGRAVSAKPEKPVPVYRSPRTPVPKPSAQVPESPTIRLTFNGEARVAWHPISTDDSPIRALDDTLGRQTRLGASGGVPREMVMGVDFGTSSTKVVIGDRVLKSAYAVPFLEGVGISQYLLPSRLVEDEERYALHGNACTHRDLKLSMLAYQNDEDHCVRVCAYLALVIRSARAWLFSTHSEQYQNADLLWTLALGQPADQATSNQSLALFKKLGEVAWFLATAPGEINHSSGKRAWRQVCSGKPLENDIEVLVMPELTAQIHGFVSSSLFDPQQSNIYLMCDVGAGTVDASVFQVKRTDTGSFSFNFFTHCVEARGVMNLHRHRVAWWVSELENHPQRAGKALDEMEAIRLPTEYSGRIPATFSEYVEGVEAESIGNAPTPDEDYFKSLVHQVKGKVLYRLWKARLLPDQTIKGMPFFLCGGGGRHGFYEQLKLKMQHQPGCSWLEAMPRELTRPSNLRADGLARADYDRLSVAFGLSQLNLESVNQVKAMAPPSVACETETSWRTNYVDKDFC